MARLDRGTRPRASVRESVQLDPEIFVLVHRSAAVNLNAICHVLRADNETGVVHLKGRPDTLPVSRMHLGLFRQMQENFAVGSIMP